MKVKSRYIVFFVIVFFSSCKWMNGEEGEPAYIHYESAQLKMPDGSLTKSHNIVDVWVSTAQGDIGVFNIPRTVPILEEGNVTVVTGGGIYLGGQTAVREKYYFYRNVVDTLQLISGEEQSYIPVFSYSNEATFSERGSDDFESSVLNYRGVNGVSIRQEEGADKAFEGKTAYVYDNAGGMPVLGVESKSPFTIPYDKVSSPLYIELDYRCSSEITVGMEYEIDGVTSENDEAVFFASDEWRHVYLDVSQDASGLPEATLYRVYVRSDSTSAGDFIGLDNIRVVYQEK